MSAEEPAAATAGVGVQAAVPGAPPDPAAGSPVALDAAAPDSPAEPDGQRDPDSAESPEPEPTLPEPVRQRVIALASSSLTGMPLDELPAALRRVAKFAPNRRAKLGGPIIAAQLASDALLRQRLATRVVDDAGELGAAVLHGTCPAAADPVEVAALAYLARPEGWLTLVDAATVAVRADAENAVIADRVREVEQRLARTEHDRAVARTEADKLRDELARLREEAAGLREEVRGLSRALREAQQRERKASEMLATEKGRVTRVAADHDAEVRRLKARLADAEAAAGSARQSASQARAAGDARVWLLLETLGQAAVGLRRELALEPTERLPADFVADESAERAGGGAGGSARALDADDPVRLDELLALPRAHLLVDGYNVTKKGFGEISLEQQRSRLVNGLGGLAAQTRAEVTVVFDGAERLVGLPPTPRGVRVLFSRKGETADELIRRLVRAEPFGRPVVVVSSDKEVADGVRRHGAHPLGSETLLRRLSRA